jgi:hypothetical protein
MPILCMLARLGRLYEPEVHRMVEATNRTWIQRGVEHDLFTTG